MDNSMFTQVLSLISQAVTVFGGGLMAWGGVRLGLAIKEHQGGASMAEAVATLVGGAVVFAAGLLFLQIA